MGIDSTVLLVSFLGFVWNKIFLLSLKDLVEKDVEDEERSFKFVWHNHDDVAEISYVDKIR